MDLDRTFEIRRRKFRVRFRFRIREGSGGRDLALLRVRQRAQELDRELDERRLRRRELHADCRPVKPATKALVSF